MSSEWLFYARPCQRCGSHDLGRAGDVDLDDPFERVYCKTCGIEGPEGNGEEEAIALWNKRNSGNVWSYISMINKK